MNGPVLKKFLNQDGDYVWGWNGDKDKEMWSLIGKHWTDMYEKYEKYKEGRKEAGDSYWVSWESYLMADGDIVVAARLDAKIIRKLAKNLELK